MLEHILLYLLKVIANGVAITGGILFVAVFAYHQLDCTLDTVIDKVFK